MPWLQVGHRAQCLWATRAVRRRSAHGWGGGHGLTCGGLHCHSKGAKGAKGANFFIRRDAAPWLRRGGTARQPTAAVATARGPRGPTFSHVEKRRLAARACRSWSLRRQTALFWQGQTVVTFSSKLFVSGRVYLLPIIICDSLSPPNTWRDSWVPASCADTIEDRSGGAILSCTLVVVGVCPKMGACAPPLRRLKKIPKFWFNSGNSKKKGYNIYSARFLA